MIVKFLLALAKLALGLVVVSCPVWIGWVMAEKWERRQSNWPDFHVSFLWVHRDIGFGDGLLADNVKLRAGYEPWRVALKQCHDNTASLRGALDRQNSLVQGLSAESVRMAAATSQAVQAARSANARALSAETSILGAPLAGADVCARYEDVHQRLTESLP